MALAMTGLLALLTPSRASGQISPGPLARPHASLEGATNCVKCHGLKGAGSPMSQVCLQCHKEITWLMQQNRGLHATEVRVGRKECASCHPDHAGVDFKLVAWKEGSPSKFDHRRAGWELEGKHTDAKCESCHTAKYRVGPAAQLSERKQGAGWVGLERNCVSCHKTDDVHANALGANCASCHDAATWEKAPGFDHDKADFRLDGKHRDVKCDACHLAPNLKVRTDAKGERIPLFKPVPFKECSSCHADPHAGRLSSKCSACHTTKGFTIVDRQDFNHSLTRYPLKGAHAEASCTSCHGKDMSRKSPAFGSCASCHADVHQGEGTIGGKSVDCASCHQVEGFAPSTFTAAQHRETNYPLEGKHLAVACARCHTPDARLASDSAARSAPNAGSAGQALVPVKKVVHLRIDGARCANCHDDAHGGQLAARVPAATCESCHAVTGFATSTFGATQHARLRLALDGAHATITCAACHGATRPGLPAWDASVSLGSAKVRLVGLDPACTSCHVDPHAGRFNAAGGTGKGSRGCTSCHDTKHFRPSTVDVAAHANYAMPLEGAHRAIPCVACHAEMGGRPQGATPTAGGAASAAAAKTPARRDSSSHGGATLLLGGGSIPALPFTRPTPRGCATCHESPHGDQFDSRPNGKDCASCHSVEEFAPAPRFDHERARFTLAGAHANVPCASCHKRVAAGGSATRVLYRPLSTACESCHTARDKREVH